MAAVLEPEHDIRLAELGRLEAARAGAEHVAEAHIIGRRHRREHVPDSVITAWIRETRDRFLWTSISRSPRTRSSASLSSWIDLLEPQLLGLVDDDEQHLVMMVGDRMLGGEQLVEARSRDALPRRLRPGLHRRRARPARPRAGARFQRDRDLLRLPDRPGGHIQIRRYRTLAGNRDQADPASADRSSTIAHPLNNHNGGWLDSARTACSMPRSATAAAAATPNNAQNPTSCYGKMLRIDPRSDAFPADPLRDYAIPAGNPFAGGGGRPEIWAYGLRNPFRNSVVHLDVEVEGLEAAVAVDQLKIDDVGVLGAEDARHFVPSAPGMSRRITREPRRAAVRASPQARSSQSASIPLASVSQPITWTSISSSSRRRPTMRSPGIGWQHSARW
jgi:hypothetical protein